LHSYKYKPQNLKKRDSNTLLLKAAADKTHSYEISEPVMVGGLKMGEIMEVTMVQCKIASIQEVGDSKSTGSIQESTPGKDSSENTPKNYWLN
jgi:hypothetical protein